MTVEKLMGYAALAAAMLYLFSQACTLLGRVLPATWAFTAFLQKAGHDAKIVADDLVKIAPAAAPVVAPLTPAEADKVLGALASAPTKEG
jgi:hypothetical protein